ncbi:hypothetical protein PPACK8108_LOCUS8542 [Phakopsora pachyrhizi]|uniref:Uncharacterized protein n=1 Tax=Phakopsora pachyrhizi TaxID=170000 RepID=A0AAV0AWG6_PHAPC|nr:hypothetical protein PPACK8108_LOCUS8542 [Phakopsora pachyrhizi]
MDTKYFRQITEGGTTGDIMWKCILCNSRATTNIQKHSVSVQHKAQLRNIQKKQLEQKHPSNIDRTSSNMVIENDSDCEEGVEEEECSIKEYSKDNMDDSETSWSSEYSDSLNNNISDAFSEPSTDGKSEECFYQESGISNHRISSSWFPFKNKEIMIGCLISGCTRSLMSRKMYNHIRQVLRLCDVDLPSWKTVQSAKSQLLKKTHCKEKMSVSIMGNSITTVSIQGLLTQELGNPLVKKYLEFYPEESKGENIYKFSQSAKWLHQYPRDLRVQMIKVGDKSYYIYEPAQLKDGNVVVPIYFYIKGGIMFSNVCKLNVFVLSSSELQISISGDLDFYASDLKEIKAQDFLKSYIKIKAHDGRLLADKCRNILLGIFLLKLI